MTYRVLIAAGGSGGHVIPAQVVAEELSSANVTISFAACGLLTNPFFDRNRWVYKDIPSAPPSLRRAVIAGPKILHGTLRALCHLRKVRPSLVVGFGSYHSLPVLAAATCLRIPIVLYTADAVPGRAVRVFAPFAQWTGCFFSDASSHLRGKSHTVDMPLRSSFACHTTKEEGCRFFDLPLSRPIVLILGGSQGAKALNEIVPKAIPLLSPLPNVIHLCGQGGDVTAITKEYKEMGVEARVRAFEPQMHNAFAAADVVIARSGASAIAEIEAFSRPALYIPYPHAMDDHQRKNARLAAARGTAIVVDENQADPKVIAAFVQRLLASPVKTCEHAAAAAQSFVEKILQTLEEVSICQRN